MSTKAQSIARKKNCNTMQARTAAPCAVIECTRKAVTDQWERKYLGIMPYRKALALRRKADQAILALPRHQMQQGGLLAYSDLIVGERTNRQIQDWVATNKALTHIQSTIKVSNDFIDKMLTIRPGDDQLVRIINRLTCRTDSRHDRGYCGCLRERCHIHGSPVPDDYKLLTHIQATGKIHRHVEVATNDD